MKKVILQKELRITVLFRQDEEEQWMYLGRTDDYEDITLRSSANCAAAIHFLAKETVVWPPSINNMMTTELQLEKMKSPPCTCGRDETQVGRHSSGRPAISMSSRENTRDLTIRSLY